MAKTTTPTIPFPRKKGKQDRRGRATVLLGGLLALLAGCLTVRGLKWLLSATLSLVNPGDPINASDHNNVVTQVNSNTTTISNNTSSINSLSSRMTSAENKLVQPRGGSESGGYTLAGNGTGTASVVSDYATCTSRQNTIASISVNTQGGGNNQGTIGTAHFSASGAQIYFFLTAANNNAFSYGTWTMNF